MTTAEIVDDILAQSGVKGMRWGVRKQYGTTTSTRSSSDVKGLEHFPKAQAASMRDIANKMEKAYGFKVDEFVPLTPRENKRGFIAYVEPRNKGHSVIHMTDDPKLKPTLSKLEKAGWFVPAGGRVIESNLTHESAHGMFHAMNVEGKGFVERLKAPAPIEHMRKSAWDKAIAQGRKDGDITERKGMRKFIEPQPEYQIAKKLSKYADNSLFIEEFEAEMFAAYHWSPNPPKFVDAFMNDIHTSMGKKVKPFSGRKA